MSATPTPVRIDVADGTEVTITWEDTSRSRLAASAVRAACPCAECREEPGRRKIEALLAGGTPVTITTARLVGAYAVSFAFGPDGHATGIYPYSLLHSLGADQRDAP